MPEPFVSIVVPVRNGGDAIEHCIRALLVQDWPADAREILVVDNRSTDDTRARAARHPVRVLVEERVQSSYAARNTGAAASRGSILAFTDADCVPDPGWVRGIVRAFDAPGVGGVAGRIEPLRARLPAERWQAERVLRADRAYRHPVLPFAQTANAAYERGVFERLGGFDASLVFGGDLDFSWRMQRETGLRLAWAPDALVRHRNRTTWGGVFALYAKNAVANCLLSERYPHYAEYPRLRTLAYNVRETLRHAAKGDGAAIRHAGEVWGWLRWHLGAVRPPATPPRAHTAGMRA